MFLVMALLAAQAQQDSTVATPPKPLTPPGTWATNDDYPPAAQRAGEQGKVGFKLEIDSSGVPTNCLVTSSSGFADLDQATCDSMRKRARFFPALDEAGKPLPSFYSAVFRWELTGASASLVAGSYSRIDLELADEDHVVRCEVRGQAPRGYNPCAPYSSGVPAQFSTEAAGGGRHRTITIEVFAGSPQAIPTLGYDEVGRKGIRYYRMDFALNEVGVVARCEARLRMGAKEAAFEPAACREVGRPALPPGAKMGPQESVMVQAVSWVEIANEQPAPATSSRPGGN